MSYDSMGNNPQKRGKPSSDYLSTLEIHLPFLRARELKYSGLPFVRA